MLRILIAAATILATAAVAQDKPGSSDHPEIPRIAGTRIVGYAAKDYGRGQFHTSTANRSLNLEEPEGRLTRLIYLGDGSLSPLGAIRNYQSALADLGQVETVFMCEANECFRNLGQAFIWANDRRLETHLGVDQYLYHQPKYITDQAYWYGQVTGTDRKFHVSVYAATRSSDDDFGDRRKFRPGDILVHLDVLEDTDFTPTLQVVPAAEIASGIAKDGAIALYGINFANDSATPLPDSAAALGEIAKVMTDDAGLQVYVVGHTDNNGGVEYNQDLSARRADAVVAELSARYGIAPDRMVPIGVGLAAPVASNATEEGRALNRRVELVAR